MTLRLKVKVMTRNANFHPRSFQMTNLGILSIFQNLTLTLIFDFERDLYNVTRSYTKGQHHPTSLTPYICTYTLKKTYFRLFKAWPWDLRSRSWLEMLIFTRGAFKWLFLALWAFFKIWPWPWPLTLSVTFQGHKILNEGQHPSTSLSPYICI